MDGLTDQRRGVSHFRDSISISHQLAVRLSAFSLEASRSVKFTLLLLNA